MSTNHKESHFGNCLRREISRLGERPLFRVVCFGVPLFCALFMATVFGDGQMNDLPVGVVDHDFSATTRAIVRAIDSSPKLATEGHYTTYQEATTALRRGQIYGFVVIPHNFEEDLMAAHRPSIECFYQYALLSVGLNRGSVLAVRGISRASVVAGGMASWVAVSAKGASESVASSISSVEAT